MHKQILHNASARARSPIGARTRHSRISVSRHRVPYPANTVAEAPAQDADLLVLQLRDQPAHDFWAGGRHIPMPPTQEGALGIIDLRSESRAIFKAELDSLHLHLPREALNDLTADIGAAPVASLSVEDGWTPNDRVVRQLAPLLVSAIEAQHAVMQAFLDHVILAMATHIAEAYGSIRRQTRRPGSLAPWQLLRAQEVLAADLVGRTSLHDVAEACGLSMSYFSRAFRASTGWTPHSWLQAQRIDRARGLLLDARLPLADVALQSGFADQSHFSRVFKSTAGQTPGAWRAMHAIKAPLELSGSSVDQPTYRVDFKR